MLKLILSALLVLSQSRCGESDLAEVSYYDEAGNYHSILTANYVTPGLRREGSSLSLPLYDVEVTSCVPNFKPISEEVFAVFMTVDHECQVQDLIDQADAYGADFIFLDIKKIELDPNDLVDYYDEPVFFLGGKIPDDLFNTRNLVSRKRLITVYFPIVL